MRAAAEFSTAAWLLGHSAFPQQSGKQFARVQMPKPTQPSKSFQNGGQKSGGDCCRIILVHDLLKKADLRDQLERTVTAASREASKSVGLSFRISVYRFNYKKIREKGEFETAFDELLGHVQKLLVSWSL